MQSEIGSVNPHQSLDRSLRNDVQKPIPRALVEKEGVFQGVVTWNELMKVKPEERSTIGLSRCR